MLKYVILFTFSTIASYFQNSSAAASGCFMPVQLYKKNGGATLEALGNSVAGAGDVNGDGRADFIIGAPYSNRGGYNATGSAFVYSGLDGSLLFLKNGSADGELLGYSVAGVGDVNADGKDDFIVGVPAAHPGLRYAGSAFVYSGLDGSLLFQKNGSAKADQLGYSVAGTGDVNGDGRPDFIVGALVDGSDLDDFSGAAFVYSGLDGSLLYQKNGSDTGAQLGRSVAGAGDVNGDGRADFIVGAPYANLGGLDSAGSVFVYSGLDGSLLFGKNGNAARGQLGNSVATVGDINGDGKADFIVGAPGANSAFIYSGATGSLLYQKADSSTYTVFGNFGFSVAGTGDVNGDGKADFIIGAPWSAPSGISDFGSVFVYSGFDGSLLFQQNGSAYLDLLGFSVAGAKDVNGDGRDDFITGARLANPGGLPYAGSAYVFISRTIMKGDLDLDLTLTPTDVVSLINVVFIDNQALSSPCVADLNCDSRLTPTDLVLELILLYVGTPIICSP